MSSKLRFILTWNIRPGLEAEYSAFINDRLAPGLVELGLPPRDVYYATYGRVPQILVVLDVPTLPALQQALQSSQWQAIKKELLTFIEDYQEKVIQVDDDSSYF
jgi:hypothetical protein